MIKASQREQGFSVRITHPPGKYLLCRKGRYNVGSWDVLVGKSHWCLSLPVALPHRSRPLSLKQITTEKAWRCLRFGDSKRLFECQKNEKRFPKNATQRSFASQVKGKKVRICLSFYHAFMPLWVFGCQESIITRRITEAVQIVHPESGDDLHCVNLQCLTNTAK